MSYVVAIPDMLASAAADASMSGIATTYDIASLPTD